jgi:membrane peptidoglycan carboxypeptidase
MEWEELLARGQWAREVSSAWLFKTRNRRAQNLRIRARIERDAFELMTPYWRQLGFPFETLVPSYATAIGSSADRPMALAELMGIIVNDGWRRPTIEIARLSFAPATPYQTVFEQAPQAGEQVMRAPVARLLRQVLAEVVNRGTAHRLSGVFIDDNGVPTPVGGKTGSGDNRIEIFARGGHLLASRAVSRTASFVFYLDERWYGVITASVSGSGAEQYNFTSALPLAVLKLLAPTLNAALREEHRDDDDFYTFELTDTGADTHIAKGLNPSTSPMTIVNRGRPRLSAPRSEKRPRVSSSNAPRWTGSRRRAAS